jgi:Lon protease-like protein
MSARELGLFPLGVALVPGELMPLHIFEERYRDLIADCMERAETFVLLYADEEGTRELGTTARVVEVLERFDDGRMNIVVEGADVVRVVELTRGRSYMTGRVETAEDDDDADPAGDAQSAVALYRQIAETTGAEADPQIESSAFPVSYAILARVELPVTDKQRILELRTERERLEQVVQLLSRGLHNLRLAAEIGHRAQGNGQLPKPGEELL